VAEACGAHALGVILTGMGDDGARGLLQMRQKGAHTLGQDEATCVVYGMPRAAFLRGAVEAQVPLPAMAGRLVAWCERES
jgi:chemotaxis response regulator CheB